jgi:hypothetical protein
MKNGLWVVVLAVAIVMGFLMGYSLPPMIEVGLIGAEPNQEVGIQSEVDEQMQEYYRKLAEEAE